MSEGRPHKDGVDEIWPTVEATDWREAMRLGGENVTYRCADGVMVTFGRRINVIPRPKDRP